MPAAVPGTRRRTLAGRWCGRVRTRAVRGDHRPCYMQLVWQLPTREEIGGDKCAWSFSNGITWTISGEWSNSAAIAGTGYPTALNGAIRRQRLRWQRIAGGRRARLAYSFETAGRTDRRFLPNCLCIICYERARLIHREKINCVYWRPATLHYFTLLYPYVHPHLHSFITYFCTTYTHGFWSKQCFLYIDLPNKYDWLNQINSTLTNA